MSKFSDIINGPEPVLVDFFATWCGPCKSLAPILEQLKQEMGGKIRIIKVDVDKNPAAAQKFQVRGVPTMVLYKNGKQLWRQSGVVPLPQLKRELESRI